MSSSPDRVQGMGGVLLENFVSDADGNPLTTSFMDLLPPTTSEVPNIYSLVAATRAGG